MKKVKGLGSTDCRLQNSHGDAENGIRNMVNNIDRPE